jgi:pimeloyl-ACP methyl ester carboxylesterase
LGSSAFAHHDYLVSLAGPKTAVIFFSNRGHDQVARIRRASSRAPNKRRPLLGGAAHEVFADCVDDIQGVVNALRRKRVKNIYIVGHSTGCQKSVYYLASGRSARNIRGAVLLCPVSDYASILKLTDGKRLRRAQAVARELVRRGERHSSLPANIWPDLIDAQRFVSLYTPDGTEELFPYAQPGKVPKRLRQIRIPLHVVLAEKDEYHDRPTQEIAAWFSANIRSVRGSVSVVRGAGHGFKGREDKVVSEVRRWLRAF